MIFSLKSQGAKTYIRAGSVDATYDYFKIA